MWLCACALALALAGSASASSSGDIPETEALPLRIEKDAEGLVLPYVEMKVQGEVRRFLLDTGAAGTQLGEDDLSRGLDTVDGAPSRGVSGVALTCSKVRVDSLTLGLTEFGPRTLSRCRQYLVGIDVLGARPFRVDLRRGEWRTPVQLSGPVGIPGVKRLERGHLALSLRWGAVDATAVFDTGANMTVALRVGTWTLRDVEVAAFSFPPQLRNDLEGAPVILGTNVIGRGIWSFDMKTRQGRVQPLP